MSLDLAALEEPIMRILSAPGTDLATISAKRVRKALLEDAQYAHLGLTAETLKMRRADVNKIISQIFNQVNRAASDGAKRKRETDDEGDRYEEAGEDENENENEHEHENEGEAQQPAEDTKAKPSKKKKAAKSVEESDAALARKLSSEINSRSRRGASLATGASSPRKTKRKSKKSAETVESEDQDEDGDGEGKPKKRGVAKGGFAKEYTLSVPLSAVLATEKLSRPQVVKKLWEYIRQQGLQNPSNKKEIICDDALRAVFAVDKIDMFRMNKVLGQHLHEG